MSSGWIYTSVEEYLDDSDRTTRGTNVIIGGKVYSVNALEAVSGLDRTNLPAPVVATSGGVAVGADAVAAGEDSVALGKGASATGAKGIAIGAGAAAGENEVVIGSAGHTTYRMPGLAASQTLNPEVLTVNGDGDLSADGGDLNRRLGRPDDTANNDGNAYARIQSIRETIDRASDAELAAMGRENIIQEFGDATRPLDADADPWPGFRFGRPGWQGHGESKGRHGRSRGRRPDRRIGVRTGGGRRPVPDEDRAGRCRPALLTGARSGGRWEMRVRLSSWTPPVKHCP